MASRTTSSPSTLLPSTSSDRAAREDAAAHLSSSGPMALRMQLLQLVDS